MITRLGLLLLLAGSGCIDFIEPELPDRGAPAVLQMTLRLLETGTAELEGRLVPGLDAAGVPRRVSDPKIRVLGRHIDPDSTTSAGTRFYQAQWTQAAGANPLEAAGPEVARLAAAPGFRWYGIQKPGPGTVNVQQGADLPLVVAVDSRPAEPEPGIRQWFLTLSDTAHVFRLSADGPPPSEIVVPARWVPAGDSVAVLLIYQQSSKIEASAEYIGLMTLDIRLAWTVRKTEPATNGKG